MTHTAACDLSRLVRILTRLGVEADVDECAGTVMVTAGPLDLEGDQPGILAGDMGDGWRADYHESLMDAGDGAPAPADVYAAMPEISSEWDARTAAEWLYRVAAGYAMAPPRGYAELASAIGLAEAAEIAREAAEAMPTQPGWMVIA